MGNVSTPPGQLGDDATLLLLEAWRREADAWGKRLERSDDAAGGLLTACLTVGAVGAAAAGYVRDNAPGSLWLVEAGVGGLCLVGAVTLLSRTFGPAMIASARGRTAARPAPPRSAATGADLLAGLLDNEQQTADDRKAVARIREVLVGGCLIVFALSVAMILWGAVTALEHTPP